MKLIGSLTSPYVRKIRVMLLEKNLRFELVIDSPWEPSTHVSEFNPLGKVPALVTDDGETLFDSNILAEYIELMDVPAGTPQFLPGERAPALRIRQLVMLADGISDAGVAVFLERKRPIELQNAAWIERQQGKIARGLDALERHASVTTWLGGGSTMSLADIAAGCTVPWLEMRLHDLVWRDGHPALARLVDTLAARPSFQRTIPPA